jgi:hypothetical protein
LCKIWSRNAPGQVNCTKIIKNLLKELFLYEHFIEINQNA